MHVRIHTHTHTLLSLSFLMLFVTVSNLSKLYISVFTNLLHVSIFHDSFDCCVKLSSVLCLRDFKPLVQFYCGPGSSVGIATDCGLDCSGSNPGGDEIFHPSRPALEPNQPPVQWVPGLYRG